MNVCSTTKSRLVSQGTYCRQVEYTSYQQIGTFGSELSIVVEQKQTTIKCYILQGMMFTMHSLSNGNFFEYSHTQHMKQ